jgi:hypothetical protein
MQAEKNIIIANINQNTTVEKAETKTPKNTIPNIYCNQNKSRSHLLTK